MSLTFFTPAEAGRRLGVSAKALRLYEERGLLAPGRTASGWRSYGPADMARAQEIAALRGLGFSLAQIARVLAGDARGLEPALAAHQEMLEGQLRSLSGAIKRICDLRTELAAGRTPQVADLVGGQALPAGVAAFDLPWPWGGERFELQGLHPLTWITGPLGSGKTRFAIGLANALADAAFVGVERTKVFENAGHRERMQATLDWLMDDGATASDELGGLVCALESTAHAALVVDYIEKGLDEPTQLALSAWLRRRGPDAIRVFAMTRSSAMLDLGAARLAERIIFCPPNHSPPIIVTPTAGAPGFEAVATCLGAPEVRARTEGVIALGPTAA